MKRLICIYIGLAILTITASAQQKSEGERLYDEGLSQWKEFCTDMTTYEINQISQKLYNLSTFFREVQRHRARLS